MLSKIYDALARTRSQISSVFQKLRDSGVTPDTIELLEETLLSADMGFEISESIVDVVKEYSEEDFLFKVEEYLISLLPPKFDLRVPEKPTVILMVGVNGSGKTTCSAKIASAYQKLGQSVMLVAADTYRAAAVEQLRIWSERAGCSIVCNEASKEPSAVLFDGLNSAMAKSKDLVIVDTAGRLHTYKNLMDELGKMNRIIDKHFSYFEPKNLIAIDATLGQNSLNQAAEFGEHVSLSGAVVTKLDGSAKGGIIFSLFQKLGVPVQFIGTGENLDDIQAFDPSGYVSGLMGTDRRDTSE